METTELLKKVRKIEIRTRGLSSHIFSGEYHSAFKGRGMAFSEVREYQPGDDIRTIDWNVTARFNHPFVKVFEEERELTVILVVDVSASGEFGTSKQFKKDLVTELCAVIAFSALQNNDKVGIIFFTDKIEKFIPPKKGKSHILRIIRELIEFKPESRKTNIGEALRYFTNAIKKRSIAFVISDFVDGPASFGRFSASTQNAPDKSLTSPSLSTPSLTASFEDALKIAGKKHDTVAIRIYDERENSMPGLGLMKLTDAETGKQMLVDTSHPGVRNFYHESAKRREEMLNRVFAKCGVDSIKIRTDQSYVQPLMGLFKKRGRK
jgi:uncharacterized protein (DUF58 family)